MVKVSTRKTNNTLRKRVPKKSVERDSTYFLKIVLYIILGSIWLRFAHPMQLGAVTLNGLPVGMIIGLFFVAHDHFAIDRKIELALLLLMTIISFFLPAGIIL